MKTLTVISALLVIGAIFFMYQNQQAQATPVEWDTTTFAPRWQTVSHPIILDTNNDGIADSVYQRSGTTTSMVLDKVFGGGIANVTFNLPRAVSTITVTKQTIWFASLSGIGTALCTAENTYFNPLTGAKGNVSKIFLSTATTFASGQSIAQNDTSGKPILFAQCLKISTTGSAKLINNIGVIRNCGNDTASYAPVIYPIYQGCTGAGHHYNGNNYTVATNAITQWHSSPMSVIGNVVQPPITYGSSPLSTNATISPSIKLYNWGHLLQNGYGAYTLPALWNQFFPAINTHSVQGLETLNYRVLDSTLTQRPYMMELTDGYQSYVGYLQADTLKYTVVNKLSFNNSPKKIFSLNNTIMDYGSNDKGTITTGHLKFVTANGIPATNFTGGVYLSVSNEPDYDIFDKSQPFSESYWLKCPSVPASAGVPIAKATTFASVGHGIWIDSSGRTNWSLSNTATTNELEMRYTTNACDNKWRNFIWTYDGSALATGVVLYVNGTSTSISTIRNTLTSSPLNDLSFSIGAFSTGNSKLVGALSNVQIFNYTLSSTDANEIFTTPKPIVTASVFNYTNRALQYYVPDTDALLLNTLATTSTLTNHTFNLQTPTTVLDGGGAGPFTLVSGYQYQIPGIFRHITPDYSNDDTNMPIFKGPTTGLTQTNIQIKNAPTDFALRIDSQYPAYNSYKYVWGLDKIEADKLFTIDLPTNICVDLWGRDISTTESSWASLGSICSTTTATHVISYIATLPIAFWEFTWGSSHNYTSTNNNLATIVRHSTIPYTYNVIVKHANGTVAINQTYSTSNLPDTRTFNVSSIQKPASLYIYSDSPQGSLIYSAYLGSSVSLASVASFFHTYFNYQGFDLLAFMPVIFASMFTRNTVGIGVVMTVVCIATLSWLSVVIIPDMWIMIMAVVAVIGLIGYRLSGYSS